MADLFDQLKDELREVVSACVKNALGEHEIGKAGDNTDFDPWKLYNAREAADILGLDRATMYDIPETELPRCRVGPARGSTRWMGADLLAYARELDPLDYQVLIERMRDEMRRPHQSSEPADDPTRVV